MIQKALVVDIKDVRALVRVRRMSACGHDCATCAGCGAPNETIEVWARNPAGARVGDTVMVRSETKRLLKLAAVVYLVPVLLFILGYVLGRLSGNESVAIIASCLLFFCGVAIVLVTNRRLARQGGVVFEISGVCER